MRSRIDALLCAGLIFAREAQVYLLDMDKLRAGIMRAAGADLSAERALGAPRRCVWAPRRRVGLMEGSMPSFFDVVDGTSPDMVPLYNRLVAMGKTTILRYENMPNVVERMGNDILQKAGPRGAYVVRI